MTDYPELDAAAERAEQVLPMCIAEVIADHLLDADARRTNDLRGLRFMADELIDKAARLMWGRSRENGLWLAADSRWRLRWRGHDALFVACGRFRMRIMKPSRSEPRQ